MGVVYRARDSQLERTVAIKLLGQHLPADDVARARLLREARTASALNHPNICTVYEVGEAEGQVYIAMEYVEGQALGALIPNGGLPLETVTRYGCQIADAIAHAHERGIIHRDLKSANVVITEEGRAKVLDFGLAKRLEQTRPSEDSRTQTALTEVGTVAGTLHYLSPEVLQGAPADVRCDLWALGVLLYEMACGRMPFQGRTAFELTGTILHAAPDPLPPALPGGLRAIIQRCLARDPAQRYQRAGEVRAALEAVQSSSIPLPAPAGTRVSRRRWLWLLVPSIALAGGVLVLRWRKPAIPEGPRVSTGGRASANRDANEYFEKGYFLLKAQSDLPRGRQMLERALSLDPSFAEARAVYGFSDWLMIDQGYSNDTSWLYKAEEELRRAIEGESHSAWAHTALAAVYLYQGRKELVPAEVDQALKANPNDVDALLWLAHYHRLNGNYEAARSLWNQALEKEPLFWPARMSLGDTLRQQGDIAGAIREQEKVLDHAPQNVYAIRYLARAYMTAGDLRSARQSLERLRPEDRQKYEVRIAWAVLLALEGRREQAVKEMDEEVSKFAKAHILATLEVAEYYAVLGDTGRALEWLDLAVRNGDERAAWFRRNPLLAGLREQPRFRQILETIASRRRK